MFVTRRIWGSWPAERKWESQVEIISRDITSTAVIKRLVLITHLYTSLTSV